MSLSGHGVEGMRMERIAWADVLKIFRNKDVLQVCCSKSMSWATFISDWTIDPSFGVGMKPFNQGTHRSSHTSTNFPSPIMKQAPFRTTPLAFSIAFQTGEACLAASKLSHSSFTLYFALRILIQRLSLLVAIIQANFASKAEFMVFDILNPKPPSLLGQHKLSQSFHARNLPSRLFGFHQNLLVRASILLHTLFGIKKEDIE